MSKNVTSTSKDVPQSMRRVYAVQSGKIQWYSFVIIIVDETVVVVAVIVIVVATAQKTTQFALFKNVTLKARDLPRSLNRVSTVQWGKIQWYLFVIIIVVVETVVVFVVAIKYLKVC